MTKLLGVTLDCKLSWSKHIDAVVAKMGRNLSINKAGPTDPSFVVPWLLFSRVVRCHKKENCNWLRTGQHGWPLDIHREQTLIIRMSISPGSKWRRDWLYHCLNLWEVLKAPSCLFNSSDTHAYPTRHDTRGLFTVPKSRTDYGRSTVLYRAMTTWNSVPHQVTDASSGTRLKKQTKIHLMEQLGLWRDTHRYRHMHTNTNASTHTHSTHTYIVILLYGGIIHGLGSS